MAVNPLDDISTKVTKKQDKIYKCYKKVFILLRCYFSTLYRGFDELIFGLWLIGVAKVLKINR